MSPLRRMMLAAIPCSMVFTLSWFGVFTYINGYVVRTLGFSNEDWTGLTLWFSGGIVFWQLLCTEISARIGRHRTISLALLAVAVAYGLIGQMQSLWALRGLLLICGFMGPVFLAVWLPLTAHAGGEKPGKALAYCQAINAIVGILTMLVGGKLLTYLGYAAGFRVFAGACVLGAVWFYVIAGPLEAGGARATPLLQAVWRRRRDLFTPALLGVIVFGYCVEPFNYHTANQLYPNLLRDMHAWMEDPISLLVALGRLPGVCMLLWLGRRMDDKHPVRVYALGMLVASCAIMFAGVSTTGIAAVLAYLLYYAGQGTAWASNAAATNNAVCPEVRDAAFALFGFTMNCVVFGVGLFHHALLARGCLLPDVFQASACVSLVGSLCLLGFSFSRYAQKPNAAE